MPRTSYVNLEIERAVRVIRFTEVEPRIDAIELEPGADPAQCYPTGRDAGSGEANAAKHDAHPRRGVAGSCRCGKRSGREGRGMSAWFLGLDPLGQALLATLFTWGLTATGAGLVFVTKTLDRRAFDAMLGGAAGVMIAASYFSLLAPAIALAEQQGAGAAWLPATTGFLAGGLFMRLLDAILPHVHPFQPAGATEGIATTWRRSVLLVAAITLHNIPEGLAIGVAFGAAAAGYPEATVGAAVALAIGIGLQNLPEGAAVSFPLRREGLTRGRAFFWGQLSAAVEPPAALLGVAAVAIAAPALPYALAFAAGAMIFVVVEELIPESHQGGHADLATLALLGGFAIMMTLDVALG